MLDLRAVAQNVLFGPKNSWAARVGSDRTAMVALAGLALLLNLMDLVSGIRMMQRYGTHTEQNPIARTLFEVGGSFGLAAVKLGVVAGGVLALIYLAHAGRARLARNCLVMISVLGLLGFSSNLV